MSSDRVKGRVARRTALALLLASPIILAPAAPPVARSAGSAVGTAGTLGATAGSPAGSAAPFGLAPTASSRHGAIAAGSIEAARAGAAILEGGGNAVDAAVAAAFALAVTYPQAGNLAGGGFLVVRTASGDEFALDFRETAPAAARREAFVDAAGEPLFGVSTRTGLAVGVPGSVRGLEAAHRRLGRLPWRVVLEPSVRLARDGFVVPPKLERDVGEERKILSAHEASWKLFLPGGKPLRPGSVLKQPDLARTLEAIASFGADAFHSGPTAEKLAAFVRATGGVMTAADLAGYTPRWRTPCVVESGPWRIVTMPPPSSGGFVLASVLGQLGFRGRTAPDLASSEDVHLLLEAERRAYADRNRWLGDPDFVPLSLSRLLGPARLRRLAASIDPARATSSWEVSAELSTAPEREETTHLSVASAEGDAVALTTTLNGAFGTGAVVPGLGVLLNNEMDDFATAPGRPNLFGLVQGEANSVRPGARPLSSMTPAIVSKAGRLRIVLGAPGGSTIPTTVLQVFLRSGPGGAPLGEAVAAPRVHQQHLPDVVFVERGGRPDPALLTALERKGHLLRERESIGVVHAVAISEHGEFLAVADPRSSGGAVGVRVPPVRSGGSRGCRGGTGMLSSASAIRSGRSAAW